MFYWNTARLTANATLPRLAAHRAAPRSYSDARFNVIFAIEKIATIDYIAGFSATRCVSQFFN